MEDGEKSQDPAGGIILSRESTWNDATGMPKTYTVLDDVKIFTLVGGLEWKGLGVCAQVLAVPVRDTGLNGVMESSPINHVHDACMRAASSLLMHGVVSASDLCACIRHMYASEQLMFHLVNMDVYCAWGYHMPVVLKR